MSVREENDLIRNRIFEIMKSKRIRQKDLANILGIEPDTVSSWKRGKSDSFTSYLAKIAAAIGTTPDYLTTGEMIQRYPGSCEAFQEYLQSPEVQKDFEDLRKQFEEKKALKLLKINNEAYSVALAYQQADNEHKRIVRSTLALENMPFPAEFEHTDEAM